MLNSNAKLLESVVGKKTSILIPISDYKFTRNLETQGLIAHLLLHASSILKCSMSVFSFPSGLRNSGPGCQFTVLKFLAVALILHWEEHNDEILS